MGFRWHPATASKDVNAAKCYLHNQTDAAQADCATDPVLFSQHLSADSAVWEAATRDLEIASCPLFVLAVRNITSLRHCPCSDHSF